MDNNNESNVIEPPPTAPATKTPKLKSDVWSILKGLKLQDQCLSSSFSSLFIVFVVVVVQDECRLLISLFYPSDISFIWTLRHVVLQRAERIHTGDCSVTFSFLENSYLKWPFMFSLCIPECNALIQ